MSQQTLWEWSGDESSGGVSREAQGGLDRSEIPADRGPDGEVERAARILHRRLEERLGTVDLVLTDNRRRMLTARRESGRTVLRLHHMFLGCGKEIVAAISDLATGDEAARDALREYVRSHRDTIHFRPDAEELQPRGDHYDLEELLESARQLIDDEVDDVAITWGRHGRGDKSIRFGSYDFDQRLIRVHPALDRSWVPTYFVEFIVYHELLHAVCPPEQTADGGRQLHTEEFERRERQYPRYEEARQWEAEHLERLLRSNGSDREEAET